MITTEDTGRRQTLRLATIPTQTEPYVETAAGRAEWAEAAAHADLESCGWCGEHGHYVVARATPRPDPDRPEALDEIVESCSCCMFGPIGKPGRGLLARLRGEQAEGDDHELTVEALSPEGRWIG